MIYPRGLLYAFIRRVPALPFLAECAASNLVLQARWRLEKRYGRGMMLSSQHDLPSTAMQSSNQQITLRKTAAICPKGKTREKARPSYDARIASSCSGFR